MSDLRRGCIGSIILLTLFVWVGNYPASLLLRCLLALNVMAIGFILAVSLFGRREP